MRNRAMSGAGSKKMGGAGIKPSPPRTPMAGKPPGAPPMGKPPGAGGMGGGMAGMGGPSPGGAPGGPPPGMGAPPPGAAGGFNMGGSVGKGDVKPRVKRGGGKHG